MVKVLKDEAWIWKELFKVFIFFRDLDLSENRENIADIGTGRLACTIFCMNDGFL